MSPRDPILRLSRAAVFAAACVAVTAGGHLFAGGSAISPAALAAAALAALALAYTLIGRERARETVLTATAGTQLALHELFAQTSRDHPADDAHGHLGMTAAHLMVALLTGWWLHRGESAVWTMLRLWGAAPLRPVRLLLPTPPGSPSRVRPAVPSSEISPPRSREFAAAVHRRGPPAAIGVG
ncbi:MFS transporter [Nonomuraea longicatena]|uniref:MFS transporter n=1 Tax=Nonomuraea longicatena TaxID=83682 RepID=A0ABN1QK06_9ACTN